MAYVWRGITRPHDREMGIAGGELIVLDLQTNEVLGVQTEDSSEAETCEIT